MSYMLICNVPNDDMQKSTMMNINSDLSVLANKQWDPKSVGPIFKLVDAVVGWHQRGMIIIRRCVSRVIMIM